MIKKGRWRRKSKEKRNPKNEREKRRESCSALYLLPD